MSACYGQRGQDSSGLNDYYGTSLNSYNNCYSPPLQQFSGYTPTGLSGLQNNSDFSTGTTGAASGGNTVATPNGSGSSTPGPSVQQRLHQPTSTSPTTTPQANSTSSTTSASCKFASSTPESTANPVGSPQDLSVSAGGSGPGSTSSDVGGAGGGGTGGGTDGDTAEGGEGASGSSGNSSSGGKQTPHIYPWMKRVHLGQSKYII